MLCLFTIWTWKKESELCHQALSPTGTNLIHVPIRWTTGPKRIPFRQTKRIRTITECPETKKRLKHAKPPNNNHQSTSTPPHANANTQETQPFTYRKSLFLKNVEQSSYKAEGISHDSSPSHKHQSTDVLWKYKREYAKNQQTSRGHPIMMLLGPAVFP